MGWGKEGEKSLCFVQPDVKGWLVFFLHCIFSYCFFNKWDEGAVQFTPFLLPVPQGRKFTHCFFIVSAWPQSYLTDKNLSLKEEATFDFEP